MPFTHLPDVQSDPGCEDAFDTDGAVHPDVHRAARECDPQPAGTGSPVSEW